MRDDGPATSLESDDAFARDDGFDDQYAVLREQARHLVTNRGERSVLNLHQVIWIDHVDAERAELHFLSCSAARIPLLELSMQGSLHPHCLFRPSGSQGRWCDPEIANGEQGLQRVSALLKRFTSPFESIDNGNDSLDFEPERFRPLDGLQ